MQRILLGLKYAYTAFFFNNKLIFALKSKKYAIFLSRKMPNVHFPYDINTQKDKKKLRQTYYRTCRIYAPIASMCSEYATLTRNDLSINKMINYSDALLSKVMFFVIFKKTYFSRNTLVPGSEYLLKRSDIFCPWFT